MRAIFAGLCLIACDTGPAPPADPPPPREVSRATSWRAPQSEHEPCNRFGYCFTCKPGGVIPDLSFKCKFKWSQFCKGERTVTVRHGSTVVHYSDGSTEQEEARSIVGAPGPCEKQ